MRKYQGENVFIANSILCISFMIVALIHFIHQAIKVRSQGKKYLFPWQFKGETNFGEVIMTDKPLLFKIIFGGLLEFIGAQAQVISFNGAISAGLNGGLSGAVTACNTVYVLIVAYFMFGEKITKINFIAILFLIASVVLVSLFTPDLPNVIDASPESAGAGSGKEIADIISKVITVEDLTFFRMQLVIGGLIASVCFGS